MAKRKLEVELNITREAEYKRALEEIRRGTSVLDSEMYKLNEKYALNSNSMEALKDKSDVLQRKLYSQKDEVEKLKEAVAEFSEKYGEADERTQKFTKKLNYAEAALYKTENAIEQNRQAMEELNGPTKGAGDVIEELAGKFGVTLPDGIIDAINSIGNVS